MPLELTRANGHQTTALIRRPSVVIESRDRTLEYHYNAKDQLIEIKRYGRASANTAIASYELIQVTSIVGSNGENSGGYTL